MSASLPLASYKLRFHDTHVRAVPARDASGCAFAGPGVDLRGDDARAILESTPLVAPYRAWLEAHEPGARWRALGADLVLRRVLITLEPRAAEERPRVVRIDAPESIALFEATAPLEDALGRACLSALRRRAAL